MSPDRRAALLTLLAASLARPWPAGAHGDHDGGPPIFVISTRRSRDGATIDLELELGNPFGVAVTCRGISATIGQAVVVERRRTLFGAEIWQPVSLLRLEPGDRLTLAPPDYRVAVRGVEEPNDKPITFQLEADFGPFGAQWTTTLASPGAPKE